MLAQLARLVDQHDRNAVADRESQVSAVADQFLAFGVIAQRRLGQRADQDLQQFRIGGALLRFGVHLRSLRRPDEIAKSAAN